MKFTNVKKALLDQGLTQTELAVKTGYSKGHVNGVVNGRFKSQRAQKLIALTLGRPFEELWGGQPDAK